MPTWNMVPNIHLAVPLLPRGALLFLLLLSCMVFSSVADGKQPCSPVKPHNYSAFTKYPTPNTLPALCYVAAFLLRSLELIFLFINIHSIGHQGEAKTEF